MTTTTTMRSSDSGKAVPGRVRRVKRGQVPTVAIVGRPNVGKSSLVNRLCDAGHVKGAIVFDEPGVTRDRVYQKAEWQGREFEVVDTGGLLFDDEDGMFAPEIREQAAIALRESCAAVLVVDGRDGRTRVDDEIASFLRKRPEALKTETTVVAVNKCENPATEATLAAEFWSLGLGEPMACSAVHGYGVAEVLDVLLPAIDRAYEEMGEDDSDEDNHREEIDVALLGRPNVGKSSLLNRFLGGQQRAIVSDLPGTTRDAVDETIAVDDCLFRFVDTAGVRRRNRVLRDSPEDKMVSRSLRAVKRADVVLLVLDATSETTDQDALLARRINADGRACVVLVNKWDLKTDKNEATSRQVETSIRAALGDVSYADVLFVSAETGQRCLRVYGALEKAAANHRKRVPTAVLNDVVRDALLWQAPPASVAAGSSGKIYYVSQTTVSPPTVVCVCNDPRLFTDNYKRYLERKLRDSLDFKGTPLRLVFRAKRLRDELRDRRAREVHRRPSSPADDQRKGKKRRPSF